MPPTTSPAPPPAPAEKEKQAAAQVDAAIAAEKKKADAAKREAELRGRILKLGVELRSLIAAGREAIARDQEKLKTREAALGDLDGAVITANDVAREDPARALAGLERARTRFDGTK